MKVFVYGTLKQGGSLHHRLGGTFLGDATASGWRMHRLGKFPCVVKGGGVVHGELYEVEDLSGLDIVEGYPCLYNRMICEVIDEHGQSHSAWIYFMHWCNSPVIMSGQWSNTMLK